jgi:hypothetical protein
LAPLYDLYVALTTLAGSAQIILFLGMPKFSKKILTQRENVKYSEFFRFFFSKMQSSTSIDFFVPKPQKVLQYMEVKLWPKQMG